MNAGRVTGTLLEHYKSLWNQKLPKIGRPELLDQDRLLTRIFHVGLAPEVFGRAESTL
ncbi:MAG TPA: hypothetical protein VJX28_02060 [Chthoniobacterales bacterium]|nr:hypothetical protein [Chthoniobacterales bacterium]